MFVHVQYAPLTHACIIHVHVYALLHTHSLTRIHVHACTLHSHAYNTYMYTPLKHAYTHTLITHSQPTPFTHTHTHTLPGCAGWSHTLLSLHVMAAICLLPSSSILQPCLSQYAVLRNRHTLAIWWVKPGYHGNTVSWRVDDCFNVYQHVSVVGTSERVWHSEKRLLPNYW